VQRLFLAAVIVLVVAGCSNDKFELGCLNTRKACWLFSPQDTSDVNSPQPVIIQQIAPVTCEATGLHKLAPLINAGQFIMGSVTEKLRPCNSFEAA
jgi:hypothetical protein